MRFGPTPLKDAQGAILAHSIALSDGPLRKGKTNCVVELMHAIDRLKDYRNMSDGDLNIQYVYNLSTRSF